MRGEREREEGGFKSESERERERGTHRGQPTKSKNFCPFSQIPWLTRFGENYLKPNSPKLSLHTNPKIDCVALSLLRKNFFPFPLKNLLLKQKLKMAGIKQWSGTSSAVPSSAVLSGSRIPHWVNHQIHSATFRDFLNRTVFRVYPLFLLLPIVNINTTINVFVAISVFFNSHRTSQSNQGLGASSQ